MSHRAPGKWFQYDVPPMLSPASNTRTRNPEDLKLCNEYSPVKPAPTTMASNLLSAFANIVKPILLNSLAS